MEKLNELADLLIDKIKEADIFDPLTVVFPDNTMQKWFKAYWLKTQKDVLMSADFKTINQGLFSFICTDRKYSLLKQTDIELILLQLLSDKDNIPSEIKELTKNKAAFFSVVEELSSLFYEYEKEETTLSNCPWQKNLYDQMIDYGKKHGFATIKYLFDNKTALVKGKHICFFGFTCFDKLTQQIIEQLKKDNDILVLSIENDETSSDYVGYTIIKSPSRLREIEQVHTFICQKIKEEKCKYNDFIILAKDISIYKNEINRVFKQDNINYPNINFSINANCPMSSPLADLLTVLADIVYKGFYTREDFSLIINNQLVKMVRNLSEEQLLDYNDVLLKLNIFRSKANNNDFMYLKKRLVLSKIVDINDQDNIVELNDEKLQPYSTFKFDDESIYKLISIIDDLNMWVELTRNNTISDIDLITQQLAKWAYSLNDGQFTNIEKIVNGIKNLNISNNALTIDMLLSIMIDNCSQSQKKDYGLFVNGVSFTNLKNNAVLNADYIFILNCNDSVLDNSEKRSELDLRVQQDINQKKKDFILQYKNANKHCYFSYLNTELKTDSELFPSSFLSILPDKKEQEISLALDETRDIDSLFTLREMINSQYYMSLLSEKKLDQAKQPQIDSAIISNNRIKISEMADYLIEPFRNKVERQFGKEYDINQIVATKEYEPLFISKKELNRICVSIICEYLKNKSLIESDKIKEKLIMDRKLPLNTKELLEKNYNLIMDKCKEMMDDYKDSIDKMIVKKLDDYLLTYNEETFTIVCDKDLIIEEDLDTISYYKLADNDEKKETNKYLYLYVASLINVLITKKTKVNLIINKKMKKSFSISEKRAQQILLDIYQGMNNYNDNYFFYIEALQDEECDFDKLIDVHIANGWRYYDDKKMFDYTTQLGYNQKDCQVQFAENREKVARLIELPFEEKKTRKNG